MFYLERCNLDAGYDEPPEEVGQSELFKSVYNEATCNLILETLMREGLKVESGEKLGKTIIFAMNHEHADMLVKQFYKLFPEKGPGYCELIDNKVEKSLELIDKFRDQQTIRIAVSVDMLDTGVDVPEVLNLVFAKRVLSKIKFFQMLGRGTRLCPDVFGAGKDKENFLVFDFFDNFAKHALSSDGESEPKPSLSASQRIYSTRVKLMFALQDVDNMSIPWRAAYWKTLRKIVLRQTKDLWSHRKRMAVKLALPQLDKLLTEADWAVLSESRVKVIDRVITPIVEGDEKEHENIKLFDLAMLKIELALAQKRGIEEAKHEVMSVRKAAKNLLGKGGIPDILAKAARLHEAESTAFWESATLESVEAMRTDIRALMVYLGRDGVGLVGLNISDEVIVLPGVGGGTLDIRTYREKVIDYLARNGSDPVVEKLRRLDPLSQDDLDKLEQVLYHDLGTKDDYEKEGHQGTLVGFVRTCLTLDESAIMEKFGEFLVGNELNSKQQEFVSEVVNFIRENGEIFPEDLVNEEPFADEDINDLFLDKQNMLDELLGIIRNINAVAA